MAQGQDPELAGAGLSGGDDRRRPRGGLTPVGTSGGLYGTSGAERRAFWRALGVIAALMVAICFVNVLTVLHDRAVDGRPVAPWEPAVWEYTSGVWILLCVLGLYPLLARATARWRRWSLLILALGLPIASVVHVAGMMASRAAVYRLIGEHYPLSLADFPYEFRKDAVTYSLLTVVLWLFRRGATAAPAPPVRPPPEPALFDIREGGRILRVPLSSILAVSSAGNYVEFALADGRKPLMRATLSAIEEELRGDGFVRTHRSWLVNAARVRLIEPEGSGDYAVELEGGARAPVSRRFPEAVAQLRGATAAT